MAQENPSGGTHALAISHLNLRRAIGILGVLFPLLLIFGELIYAEPIGIENGTVVYETESNHVEKSISRYFHTNVRHIFGGVMFTVGFFLFAYKGYEGREGSISVWRRLGDKLYVPDNVVGNAACICAIIGALFPTTIAKEQNLDWIVWVHYLFSVSFFLCLAYFSLFSFTRRKRARPYGGRKKKRDLIYLLCGIVMLACIVALIVATIVRDKSKPEGAYVFWIESVAFWVFGVSWFVKGETILKDVESNTK